MAGWPTNNKKETNDYRNRLGESTKRLKCLQINLQHSRLATDNLLKIIEEEGTDSQYTRAIYHREHNSRYPPLINSNSDRGREAVGCHSNYQQKK